MARQVVVLVGPTAVGKTGVAMALQDQLGGAERVRLISADSAMVYRGMDVGTAKPGAAELEAYPHDLIDIREPEDAYTAADFVRDADAAVAAALAREQVPVLVGGTMLYVKRFIEGIATLPQADPELRVALQAEYDRRGAQAMHAELVSLDPVAAREIHPHNVQRLLRALEVIRLTGTPLSEQWRERAGAGAAQRLDCAISVFAVLPDERKRLHERIEARFDDMLRAGFEAELRSLAARPGVHPGLPSMRSVGYRQGLEFVAGALDAQTFREQTLTATRRLAKRQLTWLRAWPDLHCLSWDAPGRVASSMRAALGKASRG